MRGSARVESKVRTQRLNTFWRTNVKVETPDEFKDYDPMLYELIGRVVETRRIPMDVFHGRQVRKVTCPPA